MEMPISQKPNQSTHKKDLYIYITEPQEQNASNVKLLRAFSGKLNINAYLLA
jgi:hypothetical protein